MPRRLAVIGHPLAAAENRAAFTNWSSFQVHLIVPKVWKARSLGTIYRCSVADVQEKTDLGKPTLYPRTVLGSGRNSLFLWWRLGRLLKKLRPDIIYCWEEPWCLSTWQVSRLARNLNVPLVFYSAENRSKILPWPFNYLQHRAFRVFSSCIVPTEEIATCVREAGYSGKVFTIPLWISTRRPLHADAATRCLAYVGRLIPLKRVHLLVECLCLLPGYRLRIIGDGPERLNLESLVRDLNLGARVEFCGHIDNAELEKALAGAAILVLPTAENLHQAEQFGKAALEGISCGLPVLASRTGNLAVLAQSLPTLAAFDLDSAEQMADAVRSIWNNFPSPEKLETARIQVQKTFGPLAATHNMEKVFASLLPDGRPS